MPNDDDTKPDPGPSSQVLEDVPARSASTKKRKSIEEPHVQENPPRKRQRVRKPKPKWDPNAPPQATTSPPPPTKYAFVHELPQHWQVWGDSTDDTHGGSQMYSSQVRECDAKIAPTTSVLDAQGMGRGRKHEVYQSKSDLKRKRKVEDVDLSIADTPQPMTGVPTGLRRPLPLVDDTGRLIFRKAREFLKDDDSALILTGMHFIRERLPDERYFEILNPNPPVSILRPEWSRSFQHTHTHIMHEFFLCVFIHFCRDISDVPGVLFAESTTGEIGALLTDEDLAVLRARLVMFHQNGMNPRYLDGSGRFPIPKKMRYPAATRLRVGALPGDNRIAIRLSDGIPRPPATRTQMHQSTASSSQSPSRQAPTRPQDPFSTLYSQNTSSPGLHSSPFLPWPAAPLLRASSSLPLPLGPSVFTSATGSGSSRTPRNAPASLLSRPQVSVSHLSRRSTPVPQAMGANTAQRYSSPHPHPRPEFLPPIPETPTTTTTGMPLISQSFSGGATPGAVTAVEGYDEVQCGSESYDRDAWYVRFNVDTKEDEWHVPLEHILEMDELLRKGIEDGYGGVQGMTGAGLAPVGYGDDYLRWWTMMTATTTTTTNVSDGARSLDLDSEIGLLMRRAAAAAYDVAPLANANSDWTWNWDEHANVNTGGDHASEESGTMVLPQLFSPQSGSGKVLDDDDARSGSLDNGDNGVNPATTESLPDSSSPSSSSNAQAHIQVDDEASVTAALSQQLAELDSWMATSELFSVDGSWIEKVYSDFYDGKTEL